MFSIQFGASLAKKLLPLAGIAGASSLRLIFAATILLIIFRPWKTKFSREALKSLFLYGLSLGLMNLTFYFALARIPLGIAVALEFTGPLTVAICFSRKKIDFLWVILAAIGIYLLVPSNLGPEALDPVGIFFALLAGFFWALYILFGKKAGKDLSIGVTASMGMFFAALVVLPFGFYLNHAQILNPAILPQGLLIAVFGSALPYSLEMIALQKLKSNTFSVLMSLEPVVACLIGIIFLGEHLSLLQWTSIALIITASLGSSLQQN